ncbi:MAG: hypothetical protein QM771_16810 [Nitrospira sp.]
MHDIHQESPFRRRALSAALLHHWSAVGLALATVIVVSPEAWALTVSPTALNFQAVQGAANPSSQAVSVSKSTKRQANWKAVDNATWLTVSPGTGTITNVAQVALAVNTAGLAAGTYTATVTITATKGGSASIPVTLTVAPATSSGTPTTPPGTGTGTMASLTWGAVTDTSLAGYKLYMGTASGRYGTPLDVGNLTSYTASNLTLGTTYYFVVTSYNSSGSESPYSNEVSKSIY